MNRRGFLSWLPTLAIPFGFAKAAEKPAPEKVWVIEQGYPDWSGPDWRHKIRWVRYQSEHADYESAEAVVAQWQEQHRQGREKLGVPFLPEHYRIVRIESDPSLVITLGDFQKLAEKTFMNGQYAS